MKRRQLALTAAIAAASLFAVACGGGGTAATPAGGCSKTWKVGLVTDVGKLSDKSFNATSWQGVKDAEADAGLCVKAQFIESTQATDYAKNMETFVQQKYDLIIGVGFLMGDDVKAEAVKNPNVKFAIVDFAYDKPPANLTGLVFKEDQAGYLVGALAGLMTKTNVIGSVNGLKIPPVQKYVDGYANGAKSTNPNIKVQSAYQGPGDGTPFNNPDWGKARGVDMINQNADILFGVGGNTGNGALLAAVQKSKMCIGVDTDQYVSYPDAKACLVTSAEKKLAVATKGIISSMVKNQWPSTGLVVFDAKNGGVGISSYHDYDSKIPADVKAKISDIQTKLASGALSTGVNI
jgi:basic membrane protein A